MSQSRKRKKPSTRPPRVTAVRLLLVALGALYLGGVWLQGVGSAVPERILPRPALYFTQVAALFARAAIVAVDYRAEAWLCEQGRWAEIDVRPYFVIDRDHKESRFHRALHFFRHHRRTLQALEDYLVERHERGDADDGLGRARIGGIRLSSVRRPIPPAGEPAQRWQRLPLSAHPEPQRRRWYWTPPSRRAERCEAPLPVEGDDE